MFNLKELKFNYRAEDWQSTFVGIRKNVVSDSFEFQLPKGFKSFPTNSFSNIKQLFFKTFKTYRKFFEEKQKLVDANQLDGFTELEDGYCIEAKDGQTVSYSKLNMLDSILDAYNELLILTVKNKLSKTNNIDYSKIDKYLHKAIYLAEDDTAFVDEMEFPKKVIDSDSPTLIQMFCFIYAEIKLALEEDIESDRVKALNTEFRELYLSHDSSLFEEETFEETIAILKDILDEIDRSTAYKDSDYWHFYDAVYKFLYGENETPDDEDGKIWGISNFAIIWEEMCFAEAKQRLTETQLLFADRVGKVQAFNNFQSPFYIQLNTRKDIRRHLRPDLVYTNFNGSVETGHFERIYRIEQIKVGLHTNVKLIAKFPNHEFYELDNIYLKYVNLNQKYQASPDDDRFKCIASIHRDSFFREVNEYFSRFQLAELMEMKPCVFNFTIIDYKYISEESCTAKYLSVERKIDIQKQLVYEFSLQLNYVGCWTYSEFWIPTFFDDGEQDYEVVKLPNEKFTESKIMVYKRNFFKLQEIYLQQDA